MESTVPFFSVHHILKIVLPKQCVWLWLNFFPFLLKGHSMVTFVTKIWEFFTFNWSQLLQQTSYQSFRGWCTLGGQSTATPPPKKKLTSVKVKHSVHVTPGDVCDFARKWVLPLNRYKAQFLWSVIEFCVNIYIFDGRHIAKHFTILNMEIHFAPVILSILL